MSRPKYDVFLSHHSGDKPDVEKLTHALEKQGFRTWLDKWNLVAGDAWQPALEQALLESKACAVFIGTSGLGPWQNQELRLAIQRQAESRQTQTENPFRVIPVLLPGATRGDRAKLGRTPTCCPRPLRRCGAVRTACICPCWAGCGRCRRPSGWCCWSISSRNCSRWRASRKRARRQRTLACTAVAVETVAIISLAFAAWQWHQQAEESYQLKWSYREQTTFLVRATVIASDEDFPTAVATLRKYRDDALAPLREILANPKAPARQRGNAALALLASRERSFALWPALA